MMYAFENTPTDEQLARMRAARLAYVRMVSAEGLFGHAFFGHRTTPEQRKRLGRLWLQARKEHNV